MLAALLIWSAIGLLLQAIVIDGLRLTFTRWHHHHLVPCHMSACLAPSFSILVLCYFMKHRPTWQPSSSSLPLMLKSCPSMDPAAGPNDPRIVFENEWGKHDTKTQHNLPLFVCKTKYYLKHGLDIEVTGNTGMTFEHTIYSRARVHKAYEFLGDTGRNLHMQKAKPI